MKLIRKVKLKFTPVIKVTDQVNLCILWLLVQVMHGVSFLSCNVTFLISISPLCFPMRCINVMKYGHVYIQLC